MANKGINLAIEEVKQNIANVITESRLPVSIVLMIINELANEVGLQYQSVINKEKEEYNKQLAEEQKS